MTWPTTNSRAIVVDGKRYLWHISRNRIDDKERPIAVGIEGQKYLLFIDPYPWDFEITPSNIAEAVRWAVAKGWTPEAGPTRYMAYSGREKAFVWLPKGIRFIHELTSNKDAPRI
jgi:hypothetical protein